MNITVRLFGNFRETTGTGHLTLSLPDGASLRDLVAHLVALYPALDGQQALWHYAVNQNHVDDEATLLRDDDRVAIFPYIAGG